MRYFSMFTGIGGFEHGIQTALPNAECVGYSEIDKYAIQTYERHFPEHKNYGDATKIKADELPDFDILCGGFPCQAFSIAGKRRGFEDTRGTLFFDVARIIEVKRPKIVFLENVKGLLNHNKGETFRVIIQTLSELGYDVQWMVLNSKFFGVPQNRERVFIIGSIRGTSKPEILPLGESNEDVAERNGENSSKSNTITATYWKGGKGTHIANQGQRIYGTEGVSKTISDGGGQGAKTGLYTMKINSATKKGYSEAEVGDGVRLEYPESKTARGRVIKGNANTLKSGTEGVVTEDMKIRRLTPIECERLQGFPDGWTEGVSDTQRYKQMGNAVTVNVIQAIAEKLI